MNPGPEISTTRLTSDQLEESVELHLRCFTTDNNYSLSYGKKFLRKTYRFFLEDEKSFGFMAYDGSKPVGLITGRLDYYVDALNNYRRSAFVLALIRNPFILFRKGMTARILLHLKKALGSKHTHTDLESAPSHREGKTATLASLCVDPAYTRYKVTDLLLTAAENYARKHKMEILRTGIAKSNLHSRFAFSKRNYKEDKHLSGDHGMFYYKELTH